MKKLALCIMVLDGLAWFAIFASQGDSELVAVGALILTVAVVLGLLGLVAPIPVAVILLVLAALFGSIALFQGSDNADPALFVFAVLAFAAPAAAAVLLVRSRARS
jgi:hypothetical protein